MSNTSNQVLFYSTEIFAAAGVQYSEVATVIVGVTLLGFTIVTVRIILFTTATAAFCVSLWAV